MHNNKCRTKNRILPTIVICGRGRFSSPYHCISHPCHNQRLQICHLLFPPNLSTAHWCLHWGHRHAYLHWSLRLLSLLWFGYRLHHLLWHYETVNLVGVKKLHCDIVRRLKTMKSSGFELARTKKTSVQRCKQDFQLARLIEMDAMNVIELNWP